MPMPYEVLYVDDSDAMQKTVSMIFLNNSEFKIIPLYDGSSIIAILNNSLPSIIIINYNISNASSYNIIKEIKNNSLYSNMPVLLAAPSDLPNKERELFVEAGLTGFIYRPFDKETFINKIKRSLGLDINEDKIYDIAEFEKKHEKIENNNNQNIQNISAEQSDNLTENTVKTDNIRADSDSGQEQDSAELSEAFENLFKDDNIFKEFQNLDKENVQIRVQENIAGSDDYNKAADAAADVTAAGTDIADNVLNITQSASANTNIAPSIEAGSIRADVRDSSGSSSVPDEISISEVVPYELESVRNIKTEHADNGEGQEILNDNMQQTNGTLHAEHADAPAAALESFNNNSDDDNIDENKINEYMSKIIINEDIGDSDNINSLNFINNNDEENMTADSAGGLDIIQPEPDKPAETEFNINMPEIYDIQESNRDEGGGIADLGGNNDVNSDTADDANENYVSEKQEQQEQNIAITAAVSDSAAAAADSNTAGKTYYNAHTIQNNSEVNAEQNYLNLAEIPELKNIDDTQISLYNINNDNNNAVRKGGNVKLEFINDEVIGKIDEYIKKSINDIMNNIQPEIIENIKNILPEIAEKLIKEEIDKIKNEDI
jgi:DNA-binding response OmpR family regulator